MSTPTIKQLSDPHWRLNNLYFIKNKEGKRIRFKLNWAQKIFYKKMWFLNIILKARQLGMSTFIQIFMLDRCLFNSNINAGVIAHTREDAQKIFEDKIKFAYDNLPDALKQKRKANTDSAREISFSNGSSIRVGVSLRSATMQYLHISEFGKICALRPDRAEEIITGALETVAQGQFIIIESTAEGDYGRFYDLCMQFINYTDKLTPLDYRFFFFPWWAHPEYVLNVRVKTPYHLISYFAELEEKGIKLSPAQKAWYIKKEAVQRSKMGREYPATAEEAFQQISEFAIYGKEIGQVLQTNRYCDLPVNTNKPVDVFLDIGKSTKAESTCAWFMQHNDPWYDFIDFYQEKLKQVGVYVRDIKSKGYNIGRWYIPHDGGDQKDYDVKTFKDRLVKAGVSENDIVVVPRVSRINIGIDMMKEKFPNCRFNKGSPALKEGWRALRAYCFSWDEKKSIAGEPVHNWASHPADAIRQFAQGYTPYDNSDWWSEEIQYPKGSVA